LNEVDARASQLEIVLNQVADAVLVFDRDGRLTYANEAAARLLGYPSVHALLEAPRQDIMRQFEVLNDSGQPLPTEYLPSRRALRGERETEAVVRYGGRAAMNAAHSSARSRSLTRMGRFPSW
jgi:PAS domain S-box-containing protein